MNGWRKGVAALVALLAVALISGCTVPEPPGAAPLRYRDQVFNNVTVTSNLQYGSAPDAQGNPVPLMLDMYRPTGDTQTSRPALVWVHGGSFTGGDKTNLVPVDVANTFAKLGYVVVSINYRLLGSNCVGNPSAAAPWRRSRPSATPRRRSAGSVPTPPPTASIPRASASAASPPAPSRRRWSASSPRMWAPAATPAGLRPWAGSCRSRAACHRRQPRQLRRRPRPVLPRHGRHNRATLVVSGHRDRDGQRRRDRHPRAPGGSGPRAVGASTDRSISSRRTGSSTGTWISPMRPGSRRRPRGPRSRC